MSKVRVMFTLSMPSSPSWNGKWSGENRAYNRVRSLFDAKVEELGIPTSFTHRWSDGWCACVDARVLGRGERAPKSDGFCGYDWMIDNIINHGSTYEPTPATT